MVYNYTLDAALLFFLIALFYEENKAIKASNKKGSDGIGIHE